VISLVIIHRDGAARCLNVSPADTLTVDGGRFVATYHASGWFGFYDWLRMSTGDIIGVRLYLDEPVPITGAALALLCSLDARNSRDVVYIFFGTDRQFDLSLSDDQDFGGNVLYLGQSGSVGLVFNEATAQGGCDI